MVLGLAVFLLIAAFLSVNAAAQTRVRSEIAIPDIPGYLTLKCDFHIHSVFSDGDVWPTVRCEEAWREGLDVLALTDHIEEKYHSYKDYIKIDRSVPYAEALPYAQSLGLLLIEGGEITREMPPGHINAIFLTDVNALDKEDYKEAVGIAAGQGAFIFYNHPGWKGQQKDGIGKWYPEHTELYLKKQLHGVEIVNGPEYYPEAHRWCIDKKLTIIADSDEHDPIGMNYEFYKGEHRPVTLVFAREKTLESVKEALFAGRTAIYREKSLIGARAYLEPIFNRSIEILNPDITVAGKKRTYVQIRNKSAVPYELEIAGEVKSLSVPEKIILYGGKIVLFTVRGIAEDMAGTETISIPYRVKNLLIAPAEVLPINIDIKVHFTPAVK